MTRHRHTRNDIRDAALRLLTDHPAARDPRTEVGHSPRYLDRGTPCCLVAVLLAEHFDATIGMLRDLDRENQRIADSQHDYWKRFTPDARRALHQLQRINDHNRGWREAVRQTFPSDLNKKENE